MPNKSISTQAEESKHPALTCKHQCSCLLTTGTMGNNLIFLFLQTPNKQLN